MIREATLSDVAALVEIEDACFETDRISPRNFRRFLTRGKADLLVDDVRGRIRGYCLIAYHSNTSLARLYSMAVAPAYRGKGLSRKLLAEAELRALDEGATRMRLEVNKNNTTAQNLYHKVGYREFGVYEDYYEDHASALRMEKELAPHLARHLDRAPYFQQTLEFTCGPACLIMAMKAQDPSVPADRDLEIQLWREATTVFMTAGHGGCGPLGLALAAVKRGFDVELSVSDETEIFVDSVRSEDKKTVIRLVEKRFLQELSETDIRINSGPLVADELRDRLDRGGVPIVLISSYRLNGDRTPHWIAVTAHDNRFIYVNDPFVDVELNRTPTDCIGIPIVPRELDRMMRFGRRKHFASLVVYPKT